MKEKTMHSFNKGICVNLGILPYIQLAALNDKEQSICDQLIMEESIDPRFGDVYARYIESMKEYLTALEVYLDIDLAEEWKQLNDSLTRE